MSTYKSTFEGVLTPILQPSLQLVFESDLKDLFDSLAGNPNVNTIVDNAQVKAHSQSELWASALISNFATALDSAITSLGLVKITVSETSPSDPSEGDLWVDTN